MIISKISRIFNKSWMFSISLSSAFSNQTFSEKKKEMLNYDSSCLCVAGEHGQWQQGSAVLQTSSVCGVRGEPAPIRPGVLHAGVSHQHPVPGPETGLRPRSAAGQTQTHGTYFTQMWICCWVCNACCVWFLQDDKWSQSFDSKLQSLLTDLEVGLGSVLRHSHPKDSGKRGHSETDVSSEFSWLRDIMSIKPLVFPACVFVHLYMMCAGIMTPLDEFSFWADVSRSGQQSRERDRAAHFSELFATVEKVHKHELLFLVLFIYYYSIYYYFELAFFFIFSDLILVNVLVILCAFVIFIIFDFIISI